MMSPYEAERLFEAEMTRRHLCDHELYACPPTAPQASAAVSWRDRLVQRMFHRTAAKSTASAAGQPRPG